MILFSVHSEYSEVFATCSKDDIRVWSTETSLELLRITVANFTCTGIQFTCDGKSIVSGKCALDILFRREKKIQSHTNFLSDSIQNEQGEQQTFTIP